MQEKLLKDLEMVHLDLGFSGYDLLKESEINIQNKINVTKRYDFGKATLVVAIPDPVDRCSNCCGFRGNCI